MILICSAENEGTTDIVCQWLNFYNKSYKRISEHDTIEINKIEINNKGVDITFSINSFEYKLSDITSYWYRRSFLNFKKIDRVEFIISGIDVSEKMNSALNREYSEIIKCFYNLLHKKAKLNTHLDNELNKLTVLNLARTRNLTIPDTMVISKKSELNFEKKLISKAIGDLIFLIDQGNVSLSTHKVNAKSLNDVFFESCFQTLIEKKYELRIFYAFNTFFASAIFSQKNTKTKLDFRNYDFDFPNRVTPFKLPTFLTRKLKLLMSDLNLKSGSIDMAVTKNNDFVFFEVNPVGQFEQVSFPCNYDLHKFIAKNL